MFYLLFSTLDAWCFRGCFLFFLPSFGVFVGEKSLANICSQDGKRRAGAKEVGVREARRFEFFFCFGRWGGARLEANFSMTFCWIYAGGGVG